MNYLLKMKFNYSKHLPLISKERQIYLINQVKYLSQIKQPIQRSPEWYAMRENMITASDWGTILGKKSYSTPEKVLLNKCNASTEKLEDNPFVMRAMQWGVKYEKVASMIYEYRNNVSIIDFGCLQHFNYSYLGASPDGITSDGIMLEIKCPFKRVIDGIISEQYYAQIQGQLEVCELDRCDFLECQIIEIPEKDYDIYVYGTEECGIVALYNNNKYKYSPLFINTLYKENWMNEMKQIPEFVGFTFWKIGLISCIPIYRNQEWFYENQPILYSFWQDVLYFREHGINKYYDNGFNNYILKNTKKNNKKTKLTSEVTINETIIMDEITTTNINDTQVMTTTHIEATNMLNDIFGKQLKYNNITNTYTIN